MISAETVTDVANSPQVVAAIWVASGALFVGLVNVGVTIWQGHLTRTGTASRENREQWWDRFVWAAERVEGPDDDYRELGATVLRQLASVDWVEASDKDMIDAILEDVTDEISDADVEEASDEQNN
ncbi:hypothetical protein [Paenarthrobacter sp. YJN-5]|uniref:hypothetical protein n=1 Tax=Paenarthrobacter sp. YJN-5 TaxID=2735316 RepID=UPI001878D8C0|nr:hypothetical protein [Paenarthrobacter sp. YJN-5]QOT16517.1 hypothetical protein HMI59_07795 [Paenarthrobacter sp. YJN-5]